MDEKTFLKQYDSSKYEKPSVTADLVILSVEDPVPENWESPADADLKVLLIKRGRHPFQGFYALPGGFANSGESLEEAAARELMEETGVTVPFLTQVGTYSRPGRDPRGWMITTAFRSFVPSGSIRPKAADDAREATWFSVCLSSEKEDKTEKPEETKSCEEKKLWRLSLIGGGKTLELVARESRIYGKYGTKQTVTLLESKDMAFDHGQILLEALLRKV